MPPEAEPKVTNIAIVEDHQLMREWLGHLIRKRPEMRVCAEADNIKSAMKMIQETHPDLVIVDLTLRGSSGLELIKDLKAQGISVPVLVLSMHDEALYADRVLRAGARGYISKQEGSAEVMKAIQKVLSDGVYLSEAMTANVLKRMTRTGSQTEVSGMQSLTDRELEVYQLIGHGKNAREIAAVLNLGESTVCTFRTRIKDKLGVRNAAELYSRAAQWVSEQGV
jgi:DNA-binding NarL/FixJ family response regulator